MTNVHILMKPTGNDVHEVIRKQAAPYLDATATMLIPFLAYLGILRFALPGGAGLAS